MDRNDSPHIRWLWFTDVAGRLAEVERCDDESCPQCADAAPMEIIEETRAA